ncbi:DNA-binding response regulator [Cohnella terricola]|uniref:DNA-binding response regulator n=1 Tax=Cohnella terricola TaxID=1289167 RepID=A0A559JTL1_9BACL|nr:DNA-binding response regulator [Cohnella terricola]TVY03215.1 DNA-binding response regulator [Cohnella terricola]
MNKFESEYRDWLNQHIAHSTGERLRRLKHRHGFGEKCLLEHAWWPVVGNLDDLHPEYEIIDANGNHYFLDFGYLRLPRPTCLESDDFGSHARDADRYNFSRGLDRQNEIGLAGWNILRFSIDKLKENPLGCQQHVRRMLESWYGEESSLMQGLSIYQREIVRLAARSTVPFTVAMACDCLGKNAKFARKQLHSLVEKGILEALSGEQRITRYALTKRGLK